MRLKRVAALATVLAAVCVAIPSVAQEYNLSPPATPVNLLWIHHSTGGHWAYKYDPSDSHCWNDGKYGIVHGQFGTRHDTMV